MVKSVEESGFGCPESRYIDGMPLLKVADKVN
jgi:hypothetical protein